MPQAQTRGARDWKGWSTDEEQRLYEAFTRPRTLPMDRSGTLEPGGLKDFGLGGKSGLRPAAMGGVGRLMAAAGAW
jgi:hypothetical protein